MTAILLDWVPSAALDEKPGGQSWLYAPCWYTQSFLVALVPYPTESASVMRDGRLGGPMGTYMGAVSLIIRRSSIDEVHAGMEWLSRQRLGKLDIRGQGKRAGTDY
jgi:hypothetical protein